MTQIYFAFSASGESLQTFRYLKEQGEQINVLVSYVYLKQWQTLNCRETAARTILDSGAFTAWQTGKAIDIGRLTQETRKEVWDEAVALDVIGDPQGSFQNALWMRARGSKAYPVFHYGDPWYLLDSYKAGWPKVGLSCRFGEKRTEAIAWLDQCFKRAWPYKFHSFGWVDKKMLRAFPFHTVDTSSWAVRPTSFGMWKRFGKLPARGKLILTSQIKYYQEQQLYLEQLWQKELQQLDQLNMSHVI